MTNNSVSRSVFCAWCGAYN